MQSRVKTKDGPVKCLVFSLNLPTAIRELFVGIFSGPMALTYWR